MNRMLIFGTSGFAREVADVAWELGYEAIFVASSALEREQWSSEDPIIVEDELERYSGEDFAIGIGDNVVRRKVAERYADRLHFPSLIHPTASFGKGQREPVLSRRGVIVCAGVRFTNGIAVGDFCIFNLNSTVGHDVVVEDFVNVAPGANISGSVRLSEGVLIGTGAAVNQGKDGRMLTVGAGTTVGSGSVVVRDCDPASVYVGAPAEKIR
ncbi:MAG: NeuD/PglB/VioB family sugar acetyltransferase [Sphingosinicella sp.]|nr:NeuD/PglB/VioB family sugar acetyltransferase [Sphingosinicella sp.]